MPQSIIPDHSILEAKTLVESDKRSEIRLNANGGNSVLIVCKPAFEKEYINAIKRLLPSDQYSIIDINELLISFLRSHKEEVESLFTTIQSSIDQIFKAPKGEESEDLYKELIMQISSSANSGKVPVLINTGALYGTGIENINIMENESVMNAKLPLVILYPGTEESEALMFLGIRSASKYRCMIIK